MKRIGKQSIQFEQPPRIVMSAAVAGKREAHGPLATDFDQTFDDTRLGNNSWESAEAMLQKEAISLALDKAGLKREQMHFVLAGDLLNQCISSTFGVRDLGIPFLGQYGACSTMAQGLFLGAVLVESGAAEYVAAVTSSHFCSAERQFRLPLEYGGQRTPTAQWTATASGCAILANYGEVKVQHGLAGKIMDYGIQDAANMGAAMAPAAADSLRQYFWDTGTKPADYDSIFTGDLGEVGSMLLQKLLMEDNLDLGRTHKDCGMMLYQPEDQQVKAGGSGCGCSASVLCGHILKNMEKGVYKNVLFVATGALMSPTSQQQKESIPGVAHVIHLTV